MRFSIICWFILFKLILINCDEVSTEQDISNKNTAIAEEKDDRPLLFATLDGSLISIEQHTGKIKWKIKDRPIVQVPLNTKDAIVPIFLPDPRDGSLYLLDNSKEPLKKLPFSIPQLVSTSPCRSSDGILYTGNKKDAWFKLDPGTGMKQQVIGWDTTSPTCPVDTSSFIYIGRSKYSIMMVDSQNQDRKWNITFFDYTSRPMSKDEVNSFELVLFASSSTGKTVALDRRRGKLLWELDLESPVVGTYLLDSEGLLTAPYTALANHTISYLSIELIMNDGMFTQDSLMKLYPTLYIGEHTYGLYAVPSLVDQNVVTITASDAGRLLLSGPNAPDGPKPYPDYPIPGKNYQMPPNMYEGDHVTFQSIPGFGNHILIFTGHYNVPKYSDTRYMLPSQQKQIKLISDASVETLKENIQLVTSKTIGIQTNVEDIEEEVKPDSNHYIIYFEGLMNNFAKWFHQQENKELQLMVIVLCGCLIAMFFYLQMQVREIQNMSQNGSKTSQDGSVGKNSAVTAFSEELPDGLVKVGKITFHPDELLGKGCEGTFVYKGEFDSRQVAVKRLLPDCFSFADREVALLRESDAHPHVVRYYCTEQDRMFRYIALELCRATLSEYIEGKFETIAISPLEILKQATLGLAHLHSLDIVHRDIKPHNVLISMPDNKGVVKAMISDFGLCKKLQVGRMSFSRRSGVTGTDGWIAPEMLHGNQRTTCAVDLFSLGCLYYYVLSNGCHAFGDSLRRQANILSGDWNLSDLKGRPWEINLQKPLLAALISDKPDDRPLCTAVLAHPMFWDSLKILAFFQDVSDRVEKAESDDPILQSLEWGSDNIVKIDWTAHIHEDVARDLRKYRTYHGNSVRDLLRALRNKKHHFRELSREAQTSLGEIPDNFTSYWNERFPLLLVHAWLSMQCVAHENSFSQYYHETHRYSLSQFRIQVRTFIVDNPISLPISPFVDNPIGRFDNHDRKTSRNKVNSERTYDADYDPNTYSPKRSNIGLYRNIKPDVATADISDKNVRLQGPIKRNHVYRKPNKRKSSSKGDEPLIWATNDK